MRRVTRPRRARARRSISALRFVRRLVLHFARRRQACEARLGALGIGEREFGFDGVETFAGACRFDCGDPGSLFEFGVEPVDLAPAIEQRPYLLRWEIDIEASSPQEAAEKAREYQTKPATTATVFDVFEKQDAFSPGFLVATIDLSNPKESQFWGSTAPASERTERATSGRRRTWRSCHEP